MKIIEMINRRSFISKAVSVISALSLTTRPRSYASTKPIKVLLYNGLILHYDEAIEFSHMIKIGKVSRIECKNMRVSIQFPRVWLDLNK
jgi:hypothetical protein